MSRLADWLLGPAPLTAPAPAVTTAAAGAVALDRRPRTPSVGWGWGDPLTPVDFDGVTPWFDRAAAMSLPTLSHARDLLCNTVAALPLTTWSVDRTTAPDVWTRVPPPSWVDRPDPDHTRQWLLAWTTDDLIFYGWSYWLVTARLATSYPRAFRRVPPGDLQYNDGRVTVTDADGHRTEVDPADVIEFCGTNDPVLANGVRAVTIALSLDAAAQRFSATTLPSGVLEEQDGSEDMSADELAGLAADFEAARLANTTAATNKYVRYREMTADASKMQLVEARTYQALELARLLDVPPYLVGAPAGTGMTYQNALQAKSDLIDWGAGPYIATIEQTLSGPNVTPYGQAVRLDQNAWLRNPFTQAPPTAVTPEDLQPPTTVTDPTPAVVQ